MAIINKTFKTKQTALEMKNFISVKLLARPELSALLDTAVWQGDILNIDSKLGKGKFTISDYKIEVYIDLNIFGSAAKKIIENTLDKELKLLDK